MLAPLCGKCHGTGPVSRVFAVLGFAVCLTSPSISHELPTSVIPVPTGASAELQQVIRTSPRREIARPPGNEIEWKSRIEEAAERNTAGVVRYIEATGIKHGREALAGVTVYRLTPATIAPENESRLFLYVHGGAYVFGGGESGLDEAALIANRVGIRVLSVDYRMPPDHPFPAALDDVVAVYSNLLEDRSPQSIIIGGTSAGGGLALAAVHQFRRLDIPFPGAIYAGTPWADLTKTGDTLYTLEGMDRILTTYDGTLGAAARLYAGDHDLTDSLISPVYGDFGGFPPTMLVTGTRDMFLSDTARTHRKLRSEGVAADLHVIEGMSHAGYHISPQTPESKAVYGELKAFIDKHLE